MIVESRNGLEQIVRPPQSHVQIRIDYYDKDQRALLSTYPNAADIDSLAGKTIEVPIAEFLANYLLYRRNPEVGGYRSYDELMENLPAAISDLNGYVKFNGKSISSTVDPCDQIGHITEHIGESIGLSVVNRLHDLTMADWMRIPQERGAGAKKTFDWKNASDGVRIVELETKGSCLLEASSKSQAIYQHKASIVEKKAQRAYHEQDSQFVRYGAITAYEKSQDGVAHCWLVDPDPQTRISDPRAFRLIRRMRFLYEWVLPLKPRSALVVALRNRLLALEKLSNPFELDELPLEDGDGKKFEFERFNHFDEGTFGFFSGRSRVESSQVGGLVHPLSTSHLLFVGILEDLVVLAADQSFGKILQYRHRAGTHKKTVKCVIRKSELKKYRLVRKNLRSYRENTNQVSFNLDGELYYSPEGLVFGVLEIPNE